MAATAILQTGSEHFDRRLGTILTCAAPGLQSEGLLAASIREYCAGIGSQPPAAGIEALQRGRVSVASLQELHAQAGLFAK